MNDMFVHMFAVVFWDAVFFMQDRVDVLASHFGKSGKQTQKYSILLRVVDKGTTAMAMQPTSLIALGALFFFCCLHSSSRMDSPTNAA